MGKWYTRVCRGRDGRADARHDLELYPCLYKLLGLFTAPAEDERVAPFEAADDLALLRLIDKCLVYLVLRHVMLSAALAGIDELRVMVDVIEHLRVEVEIIHHDIGLP